MKIKIMRLPNYPTDWELPIYGSAGAACFDLRAIVPEGSCRVYDWETARFQTGLAFEIPEGYALFLRPRSGLAIKHGLSIFQGTIDSDYRGEVMILAFMLESDSAYDINHGDKIAQGYITKADRVQWEEVAELSETVRGVGGFGSTGR